MKIMGKNQKNIESLVQHVLKNNSNPKVEDIKEIARLFLELGESEGVRGDIAFCQAIKETGYFKFGGDVVPEQNNYAGIGTTGGGVKGAYFNSPRDGILAQIQHLKAYASKESLKNTCVDPRYNLVEKGISPKWENLDGKWAVPGKGYGEDILKIYDSIQDIEKKTKKIERSDSPLKNKKYLVIYNGAVDKRSAEYLSYKLDCPIKENRNINVKDYDIVYFIGGGNHPSGVKVIKGTDRYLTAKAVIDFMKTI